jgi:dTDP-glucose 4,6-dehydratase
VLGTQVLLDHARHNGMRHVQVSTDEVYGDVPLDAAPCTEDAPLRPSSPYSASKAGGDLQVLAYVRTYGTDALITRGANTFGPRQYPEKMLPLFITNAFDAEPLPVYGDGKQRREWLHADDHCAGIELALRRGEGGQVYNIGGQERENMDVVRRILDLTGGSPDLVRMVADRPGHDRRYSVDSTKLRALGWAPQHSFDGGGLEETVQWYRDNREWWEPIKQGEYRRYYETQYSARLQA